MAVLRAKPEWQAELRHLLVGEELAAINRSIERLDGTVESLAGTVKDLEATVASFITWSQHMFERMDHRLAKLEADLEVVKDDVGGFKGWRLEACYRDRATAVFGHVLDKVKVISPGDLRSFWKDGVITEEEGRDIRRLDLLIEGVDDDGNRRRAAVEISFRADAGDLERAVRRAAVVARTGTPCWPVVATTEVAPEMPDLVRGRSAALLRDGDVEYWPEAG
jgi:hypothetical protein